MKAGSQPDARVCCDPRGRHGSLCQELLRSALLLTRLLLLLSLPEEITQGRIDPDPPPLKWSDLRYDLSGQKKEDALYPSPDTPRAKLFF